MQKLSMAEKVRQMTLLTDLQATAIEIVVLNWEGTIKHTWKSSTKVRQQTSWQMKGEIKVALLN